jgi:hypothetical protein
VCRWKGCRPYHAAALQRLSTRQEAHNQQQQQQQHDAKVCSTAALCCHVWAITRILQQRTTGPGATSTLFMCHAGVVSITTL